MAKSTFKHLHIGRPGAPLHAHRKRDSACTTGGFYTSPVTGQTVDVSQPLNITWDTSCLNTSAADIYLIGTGLESPQIHLWHNVNFGLGNYQATLDPSWWNGTSSVGLQITIVQINQPLWQNPLPAGPVFTATYSGPSVSDDVSGGVTENVNNFKHGMSKGAIAAAVILPLLVVGALIGAAYIKLSRAKGKDKRKQWSEQVDKRMSTISTDWKSVTPAGATAAIRNSMAVGDRKSSISFGGVRPSSTIALEGGQAGIGTHGLQAHGDAEGVPEMSQRRPGLRASAFGERISRVSFAADTRPSGEYRRTRAFQNADLPPLPQLETDESGALSPTQASGPLTLTAEDIHARMTGQFGRPSMDEYMPALSMMRTGDQSEGNDDMLLVKSTSPTMPSPPSPAHQIPKSPIMGVMPMQPMPAHVMSPDDMLRAYAERRTLGAGSTSMMMGPAMPAPVANYNGTGMRTLYAPSSPETSAAVVPSTLRKSFAPTEDSHYDEGDEDPYAGTAE